MENILGTIIILAALIFVFYLLFSKKFWKMVGGHVVNGAAKFIGKIILSIVGLILLVIYLSSFSK